MSCIDIPDVIFCDYSNGYVVVMDETSPNALKKHKIFHFTDKLLLANMAASSCLRENGLPYNFFLLKS